MATNDKPLNERYDDFKGQHLCVSCWDGYHKCRYGNCECDCIRLEQNKAEERQKLKNLRAANKRAQTAISMDDAITISPEPERAGRGR